MRFLPLLLVSGAMIFSCVLISCGSDKIDEDTFTGQYYSFPCSTYVSTLDPCKASSLNEESIVSQIYDTLVSLDSDCNLIPEIAESWDYDSENLTYTFHIRKGIRFHNGNELKANDVKASFERLVNPDIDSVNAKSGMWIKGTSSYVNGEKDEVSGITVVDDYTLQIELFDVYVPFIKNLSTVSFSIMPESLAKETDPERFKPVGSGPFKFSKTFDDGSVELDAFQEYYSGAPLLAGIKYRLIEDSEVMMDEYREGKIHHTWLYPELAEKILKDDTIAGEIYTYPVNAVYCYAFNLDKTSKFGGSNENKRLLRQAVNYAVDREKICSEVMAGRCLPCGSLIPDGICGYKNPLHDRITYKHDIEEAKRLLELAGSPSGENVPKVSLFTTYEEPNIKIAEVFQSGLSEIGLDVEIVAKDKDNYLKAVKEGDPALFSFEWYMRSPDLDSFLSMFHTENAKDGYNVARMTRDYIDALIEDTRKAENPTERNNCILELEQQIWYDAPWVFMYQQKNAILVQPEVEGLLNQLGPFDYRESISHVRMEKVNLKKTEVKEDEQN